MGSKNKHVVVGYDGSRQSEYALEWAAKVAQRRGVSLLVVNATGVERSGVEMARPGVLELYQQQAQKTAEEGARHARKFADIVVEAEGQHCGATSALVARSNDASLVVIGHRGHGPISQALLGAVAVKTSIHAACPVAVIRHSPRPLPSMDYPIVVGVDGSEYSMPALDEAARLAADTDSFLRVVVAWDRPDEKLWFGPSASARNSNLYQQVISDACRQAADTAAWAVAHVQEVYPALKVEQTVSEGPAEGAILKAAGDASLIVVGARGHGTFKELLLGSVSRKVMQHAECAVYVVR